MPSDDADRESPFVLRRSETEYASVRRGHVARFRFGDRRRAGGKECRNAMHVHDVNDSARSNRT